MSTALARIDRAKMIEAYVAMKLAEVGKLPLCRGPEPDGRLIPIEGGESALLASEALVRDMPALAFSPEQVAKLTPFGRSYIFDACAAGTLKSRKVGKHRVIMARDLVEFLVGESLAE
jgi:hypothetical protein